MSEQAASGRYIGRSGGSRRSWKFFRDSSICRRGGDEVNLNNERWARSLRSQPPRPAGRTRRRSSARTGAAGSLVTRFTDAVRRGERPSIEEYVERYGEWADQIRELFPLIESLEQWKSEKEVQCLRQNLPDEFPVRRVGDYEFVRELGRGGMGIVFEAIRQSTGERFAVKLLPWRFATDMAQWKERFQREAATIARLRHPNIVRVYAFGTHEGYCYYVMQLVEG